MPPIDELLKAGDYPAAINELRNGRITTLPNSEQYAAQYDPAKHDINDPRKRPDKLVVIDKDSEEYGTSQEHQRKRRTYHGTGV